MGTMENGEVTSMWPYLRKDPNRMTTVVALWASFLIAYLNVTIPLPFLAKVMKDMNAEETWVGFAFAFQPAGVVASQFLCGWVLAKVGNSKMFFGGAVLAAIATGITAFLMHMTDDTTTFVALLCLFRFLNGFGEGFLDTACLNLYQVVAPGALAQVVAVSEGCIGIGVALGPLLGGGLYALQGFELPLLVGAALVLAAGLVVPWLLSRCELGETSPKASTEKTGLMRADAADQADHAEQGAQHSSAAAGEESKQPKELTKWHVFTLGLIFFNTFTTCYSMGAMDGITPLELTDKLGYSSALSGVILGGVGLVYLVAGLLLGKHIDRLTHENRLNGNTLIVGAVINFASCVLLGPAEWLPAMSDTALQAVIISGIILNGIGMAFALIPGMSLFHVLSSSHSMASTLFNASLNLGVALGAPLCGYLTQEYSYPRAMMTTYALAAAAVVILALFLPYVFKRAIAGYTHTAH
eukprot:TRINITY_DN1209_c0_g1_i1.p1 TRINITY_DN1209_c0_g1~~TRINITY_DN1209_c0_g1_i1.p1  ORF type:complete len:469 (+),score=188.50 TRINITY_DN1209_c0_g1_i1:55-1461(+)